MFEVAGLTSTLSRSRTCSNRRTSRQMDTPAIGLFSLLVRTRRPCNRSFGRFGRRAFLLSTSARAHWSVF
jgi:hypothetical protein